MGTRVLLTACISTDELEPALKTTLQLLGKLGICSPGASARVPEASARVLCLLEELKDLITKKDLELNRCGSGLPLPLHPFPPLSILPFFSVGLLEVEPYPAAISGEDCLGFWGLCC